MDANDLLRAAAANHRSWFRRHARVAGGRVERLGPVDLIVAGGEATIAFPRSGRVEAAAARIHALGLPQASCWSLAPDPALGTRLVARGFGWGWQPHWMALDLRRPPAEDLRHAVVESPGRIPAGVPYASEAPDPPATFHLAVRRGGEIVGHAAVNPWRGVAGIYSMGVSAGHRRQGVGRALTVAACRIASGRGCTHAILNATDEGERLYRAVGFESLGWGQTWWYTAGRAPTARQTALAEAIGFGDLNALERLRPSSAELARRLPGGTSPLRLAVVTDRLESTRWMLDRAPRLVEARFEPFGGTLLHLAVECHRADVAELALARGTDPAVPDRSFDSTPLGWAEHFGLPGLAALLRAATPS